VVGARSVQPATLVATLVECWEDLPRLLGASWAQLFPRVVDLAAALHQTSDPDRQANLAMQLALLFKDHPPEPTDYAKPWRPPSVGRLLRTSHCRPCRSGRRRWRG
jgi:hypothetical protein